MVCLEIVIGCSKPHPDIVVLKSELFKESRPGIRLFDSFPNPASELAPNTYIAFVEETVYPISQEVREFVGKPTDTSIHYDIEQRLHVILKCQRPLRSMDWVQGAD